MKNWKYGLQAELAKEVGITEGHLNNILKRRFRAGIDLSFRLEEACFKRGMVIPKEDWVFNKESNNPFFSTKEVIGGIQ